MSINSTSHFLTTPFITLMVKLFVIGLLTVGCSANQEALTPPPDFQLMTEANLSARSYETEIVGEFTLEETAVTTIFYSLPNIDTTRFDLGLSGPNDEIFVILHSEDYRTDDNGGGTWEQRLPAGAYQLLLTVPQTSGTLSVYWHHK